MSLVQQISNLATRIGTEIKSLRSRSVKSLYVSQTVALGLIGTTPQDVTINFGQTLPDTNYSVVVRPVASSSILGNLEIVDPPKTKAADKVVLTYKSTGINLSGSVKLQVQIIYLG